MQEGTRISLSGFAGTVRYVGALDSSPSLWIGVEWDNPSRGKHSGTYKDQQVFTCAPGSGSFLKAEKVKLDATFTFYEAVVSKYVDRVSGQEEEVAVVPGISKPVQSIGFDKLKTKFGDLPNATEIFVPFCRINQLSSQDLHLPLLRNLDLSWNLLHDFAELLSLTINHSQLDTLKIEGNRFDPKTIDLAKGIQHSLIHLSMNLTHMSWDQIFKVLEHYPRTSTLKVALNDLKDCNTGSSRSIAELDLHGNKIADLHGLLEHFPCVQSLILSENDVRTISRRLDDCDHPLEHLNLAGNPMDLEDAANLGCYRRLRSLQWAMTFDEKKDTDIRLKLIRLLPQLTIVNKTKITAQERQDAESSGVPGVRPNLSLADNLIHLAFVIDDTTKIEKKILRTQTVKQLKTVFARLAKVRPSSVRNLTFSDGQQTILLENDFAQLSYYTSSSRGEVALS